MRNLKKTPGSVEERGGRRSRGHQQPRREANPRKSDSADCYKFTVPALPPRPPRGRTQATTRQGQQIFPVDIRSKPSPEHHTPEHHSHTPATSNPQNLSPSPEHRGDQRILTPEGRSHHPESLRGSPDRRITAKDPVRRSQHRDKGGSKRVMRWVLGVCAMVMCVACMSLAFSTGVAIGKRRSQQ